ncbi:MAG: replicative DNA helicase [Roseateles sp.]|nr:MAG: replicative DNA helicase [Roseateles sp.]
MKNRDSSEGLRLPPQSVEAEQSVLGALLIDNAAWDRIAGQLNAEDFYRFEHKHIFTAIGALLNEGKPADVVTVFDGLRAIDRAEDCGGLSYLNALAQSVPSASNLRHYAKIVREVGTKRRLLAAADEIATSACEEKNKDIEELIGDAEAKILAIGDSSARVRNSMQEMPTLVSQMIDHVSALAEKGESVTGVSTGFDELDRMTAGLQAGDLIVLAARPSMGKTALVLNIGEKVAVQDGLPVVIFSMEMGAAQLVLRMAGSVGRIDQQRLRTGQMVDEEWRRLTEASDRIGNAPIFIDETSALTHGELRARARRQARRCGKLGLIVVDYLQLMSGTGGTEENRATSLGEISRNLKALAKELQCPVIALSQLNRGVESRTDKRPMMSDLRESGAIEQDADIIMFIYRDDYYNKDASKEPGVAEIIISKQRNGPTGTVRLGFNKPISKFENLA